MNDFIQTKGSQLKENAKQDFKVVTYESYKSKKRNGDSTDEISSKSEPSRTEFNVKKAKFEVMKLGMSGFVGEKKEEAKIQLAIKLGAKPPKNKYKNYKELIKERKTFKAQEEKMAKLQQSGKNKLGKSTAKGKSYDRKRRKEKGGLLDVYGKVKPNNNKK